MQLTYHTVDNCKSIIQILPTTFLEVSGELLTDLKKKKKTLLKHPKYSTLHHLEMMYSQYSKENHASLLKSIGQGLMIVPVSFYIMVS